MSDDRPTHRVVGKYYQWGDEVYEPGDELTPPESALRTHAARFEKIDYGALEEPEVDDADEVEEEDDAEEDEVEPSAPFDPSDFTVPQLRDRLTRVENVVMLETLREIERNGEGRKTAVDAIDRRIEELEE